MATKHNVSSADTLFVGRGFDSRLHAFNGGRNGVEWSPLLRASLGTPALAVADFLIKAATSTELPNAATITYLASADTGALSPVDGTATTTTISVDGVDVVVWDVRDGSTYGRNIAMAKTAGSVAMTVVVNGYDYLKKAISESSAVGTGTTASATGKKAFAYVKSIAITSAGDATANTFNVGTGSVLGLPYKLSKIGDVVSTTIGGVQELINVASNATFVAAVTTTASATTGDVRGTVTYTTALDGSKEPIVFYYVAGRNSAAGLVGVTQA